MPDVVLHLGDCLEYMRTLPNGAVDAVVTDPPYLDGDLSAILPELLRVSKRLVLTPGKLEAFNWIQRKVPVWEYAWQSNTKSIGGRAALHIGWEPILAYGWPLRPLGTDLLVYPIGMPDQRNGHVWPKPERLVVKLVMHWSNPGDIVFDPFMGSGTTGAACVRTGRRFIGCEIDPTYYAIAQRRIAEAQMQPPLFPHSTNGVEYTQIELDNASTA